MYEVIKSQFAEESSIVLLIKYAFAYFIPENFPRRSRVASDSSVRPDMKSNDTVLERIEVSMSDAQEALLKSFRNQLISSFPFEMFTKDCKTRVLRYLFFNREHF